MGCHDFELDLSMAPSHARGLGELIGRCAGVTYSIDDFGLKISDEFNSKTPLDKYWTDLCVFGSKKVPVPENMARENFVVGLITGVVGRETELNLVGSEV